MFYSFWLGTLPVMPTNMNWSSLLYGATVLFSLVFYTCHGILTRNGPVCKVMVDGAVALGRDMA